MDKEYNSPNVQSIMNKVTLFISKQHIINYFIEIFKTLSNENNLIELITFFNYMKLPIFICKKIFFPFSKNDVLNQNSFLKLFCGLYFNILLIKSTASLSISLCQAILSLLILYFIVWTSKP